MNDEVRTSNTEKRVEELRKKGYGNTLLGVGLAFVLASAAFFSGIQVGSGYSGEDNLEAGLFAAVFAPSAEPKADVDLDTFWRVWRLLDKKFVAATTSDSVTTKERIYGATRGMVASFNDPYTTFLPPNDANQFEEDISGNFGGVGMEVGLRDGFVTVIAPLPESPAAAAGVLAGDVVIKVDDTETEGMGINEAVRLIRGEKGTDVTLTMFREGSSELKEITITRDTISIPTLETEMVEGVFIIRLFSFNALAEEKMQDALREYLRSDAEQLILDLRGNPGGFLQGAVTIASYFLPEGEVVVEEDFGDSRDGRTYRSRGGVIQEFAPDDFVVLVDRGSASASEIIAGALKEHGVATLIGSHTFGKGSVQELVELPDGSSLKVTIARWLTPNGTSFSGDGLEPNIEVVRTKDDREEDRDIQQEAALRWLAGDRDIGTEKSATAAAFSE